MRLPGEPWIGGKVVVWRASAAVIAIRTIVCGGRNVGYLGTEKES